MKIFSTKLFKSITQKHWIRVTTAKPLCTYYFGPFLTNKGAKFAQSGFIEDLESENAEGIKAEIKCCQPQELTFCDESVDSCDLAFV